MHVCQVGENHCLLAIVNSGKAIVNLRRLFWMDIKRQEGALQALARSRIWQD